MPLDASRLGEPSPGPTAHRPRFAAREQPSCPIRMAGWVARRVYRCPDPSRIEGDSTPIARRTAHCSGSQCRARDCHESCWGSRGRHPVLDSAPRSVASRWPLARSRPRSRGKCAESPPLRPERSRVSRCTTSLRTKISRHLPVVLQPSTSSSRRGTGWPNREAEG